MDRVAVISLGRRLLAVSSNLPEAQAGPSSPRLCLVLLPAGVAKPAGHPAAGEALNSPFRPYPHTCARAVCFLLPFPSDRSAWTLSRAVLGWSPDFPRVGQAHPRLPGHLPTCFIISRVGRGVKRGGADMSGSTPLRFSRVVVYFPAAEKYFSLLRKHAPSLAWG
jgi:hypothetical protein